MTATTKLAEFNDAELLKAFIDAAKEGDMAALHRIPLEKQKAFADREDPRTARLGQTAMIFAAQNGHENIVAHLLSLSANPGRSDRLDWTPLIAAAGEGHAGVVKLLLDAGADIDAQDISGRAALHDALEGGHAETALLLLARRADPFLRDEDGDDALAVAKRARLDTVIPALEKVIAELGTFKAVGRTSRNVNAPPAAKFRRRA